MPILIALQSLIFRNLRVLRLFLNSDFAKNLTYMMSFLQLLFASLPWVFQQTLSPAKKLTIILLNNYINTLGLSTARASNFFFIWWPVPQVSELWLATLVGMTGLSCPLGISSFVLCLFDLMTKLVQSKWLNTDLILKNCSKNLSQYPIKPTEKASSITLCLQYRFKVHVEQCSLIPKDYNKCDYLWWQSTGWSGQVFLSKNAHGL